jgi:hypothetical protein
MLNPPHKPFAQLLAVLAQISDRTKGDTLEKISLECHCITPMARRTYQSEKALAKTWQPLDTALSASSEMGLDSARSRATFAKLEEVEVVLSASTMSPFEIRWVMAEKGKLLPNVEARGVTLTMKVGKGGEEMRLLNQLREM